MTIHSFHDLVVWQKSIDLIESVYEISRTFPNDEKYGLTSQIRRAAVSIASNIAEGSALKGTGELLRFLNIAKGLLAEVQTQLIIAERLKYISRETLHALIEQSDEIGRMLRGLANSLSTAKNSSPTTHHLSHEAMPA